MGESRRRKGAAARGEYPAPQLVTLMAVVRIKGSTVTLEPAGEPWVIPPRSRLCGQVSFPIRPSDDGLVFPIRMWLVDYDDPREPPHVAADDAIKELARARQQRAQTSENS